MGYRRITISCTNLRKYRQSFTSYEDLSKISEHSDTTSTKLFSCTCSEFLVTMKITWFRLGVKENVWQKKKNATHPHGLFISATASARPTIRFLWETLGLVLFSSQSYFSLSADGNISTQYTFRQTIAINTFKRGIPADDIRLLTKVQIKIQQQERKSTQTTQGTNTEMRLKML